MPVMFDSVTVSEIPANAEAVAGYVAGTWPTFPALVARFPHAYRLSIAINADEDADCLDCEPGDAIIAQAPAWFRRQKARGLELPCIYTSAGYVQQLIDTMTAAGIGRGEYRIWSAHYTYREHICSPSSCGYPQADSTQWTDRSQGRNLDQSLCSPAFFQTHPAPKPRPAGRNPHYEWFQTGPFRIGKRWIRERATVMEYDRLRKHGVLNTLRLRPIRADLKLLATRIENLHDQTVFHRSWRARQLRDRANGKRLV